MLPEEIAWRQKEQFSDGVGYNWIDTLKKITSELITDEEMKQAADRFPDQHAAKQGRILLPYDLRRTLPE